MSEKWIDVNDKNRLPPITLFKEGYIEPQKTIIMYIDFGDGGTDCVTGWWTGDCFMERDGGRGTLWEVFNVTHWKPIPKPPNENAKEEEVE